MVNNVKKFKNLFDEFSDKELNICGIDEAGRGPLAGPLIVVGVILLKDIKGLNDSKKLSQRRREELYSLIVANSRYHIVIFEASTIDNEGISNCLRKGLEEIVDILGENGVSFIFDGNCNYGVKDINTMIKADAKVPEVSASSIIAKVTRDNIMQKEAKVYPNYGFETHKGYGTKKHIEAIKCYGLSPIHRKSFQIKKLSKIAKEKGFF